MKKLKSITKATTVVCLSAPLLTSCFWGETLDCFGLKIPHAIILPQIDQKAKGYTKEELGYKLTVNGAFDLKSQECRMFIDLDVTFDRPIRDSSNGYLTVVGDVILAGNGQLCLTNPDIYNINLEDTSNLEEEILESYAPYILENPFCMSELDPSPADVD